MTPAQLQALRLVQGIAPSNTSETSDAWDFKEFLLGITHRYHTDVSSYDTVPTLENLVRELDMSLVTLYDHPHDSDECCSVEFLLVGGIPLAGWKKVGDHSDYTDGLVVFNDAQARALALRVWALVHEEAEKPTNEDTIDVLEWAFADNSYLTPLKDAPADLVTYAINSPRWMLGRLGMKTRRLFVLNEDDTFLPVVRVVGTNMSAERYGKEAYHRTVVELEDGSQREVDSQYIVHTPLRA